MTIIYYTSEPPKDCKMSHSRQIRKPMSGQSAAKHSSSSSSGVGLGAVGGCPVGGTGAGVGGGLCVALAQISSNVKASPLPGTLSAPSNVIFSTLASDEMVKPKKPLGMPLMAMTTLDVCSVMLNLTPSAGVWSPTDEKNARQLATGTVYVVSTTIGLVVSLSTYNDANGLPDVNACVILFAKPDDDVVAGGFRTIVKRGVLGVEGKSAATDTLLVSNSTSPFVKVSKPAHHWDGPAAAKNAWLFVYVTKLAMNCSAARALLDFKTFNSTWVMGRARARHIGGDVK
jgi:hypothetical protein